MRMQEAMAALSGGKTVDVRTMMGGATMTPTDSTGGTTTQTQTERNVSLG